MRILCDSSVSLVVRSTCLSFMLRCASAGITCACQTLTIFQKHEEKFDFEIMKSKIQPSDLGIFLHFCQLRGCLVLLKCYLVLLNCYLALRIQQ